MAEARSKTIPPGETRITGSDAALESFLRRNRFNSIYFLLYNLGGQFLEPRSKQYWEWTAFTAANICLCLVRLYVDLNLRRPAALHPAQSAARHRPENLALLPAVLDHLRHVLRVRL